MTFMPPLLLALAAATAFTAQEPSGAVLTGIVRSELTGAPLPAAVIELGVGTVARVAVADQAGRYSIERVPPGRRAVSARYPGYERLEVEVWIPHEGRVNVDLTLEPRPVELPPVTATARRGAAEATEDDKQPAPGLALIGIRAAAGTPGLAELGLMTDHGGAAPDPGDPGSVLYVRGASTDVKLVLLDGAPVHAPFHLGGVIEPFEPLALGSVNLHLGGAPARHHGGLAYVLELESREPGGDEMRIAGGLDMVSARAVVNAAVGSNAGVLMAGRMLHGHGVDAFLKDRFPYGYSDALARTDLDLGPGRLTVTGFMNRERIRLGLSEMEDKAIGWGNTAGSARYRTRLNETDVTLTLGHGRFVAELPYQDTVRGADRGIVRRTRVAADAVRQLGQILVAYGAAAEGYTHEQRINDGANGGAATSAMVQGSVAGGYAEAAIGLSDRAVLRGGGRVEFFSGEPLPHLAPRVSATWIPGDGVVLTLAAGRHHQHVRMLPADEPDRSKALAEPTSFGDTGFQVAHATDLTLSLDHKMSERARLGLSGFVKAYEGLASPSGRDQIRSSGLDVTASGGAQRITGWAGYSLAWVWNPQGPQLATPLFSGRHVVSAGMRGKLGSMSAFELGVVYGAGLPHSAIIPATMSAPNDEQIAAAAFVRSSSQTGYLEGGELDPRGELDRPYLRIDASLRHTWSPRVNGRDGSLSTYVRLLNALDRRDAIFYLREGADARPLSALPILPVVGVEWNF